MAQLHRLLIALALTMVSITSAAQAIDNAFVIDTRSLAEYEAGHLEGAVLIPYDAIEARIFNLTQDKEATIYLYCRSGGRAEIARKRLQHRGFTKVTNLGGLEDARMFLAGEE